MKLSLLSAVIILAIAALIGWQDHRRLAVARETRERLFADAVALGVSTGHLRSGDPSVLPGKTSRLGAIDPAVHARDFAGRLAKFALEMDARQRDGGPPGEEFQRELIGLIDEMLQLDAAQLKLLIGELRANGELTGEMRRNIVGFAITMLASDHPASALAIFTESSDLFGDKDRGSHVLGGALSKWASQDPAAALEWVRQNSAVHPDLVTEETKRGLIGGAAKQDPRLAFRLIGELGLEDADSAGREIARSADTPAARGAILSALREHLAAGAGDLQSSLRSSTLGALAEGAMKDGFDSATAWMDGAGLDTAETATMADSLDGWKTGVDTGKWIEWMGGNVSDEPLETKVTQLMGQWTRSDYKAAGLWLSQAADGPAKQAAVKSYAETVAPYDSAAAAQWAKTLPPGKDRDELLEAIGQAGQNLR